MLPDCAMASSSSYSSAADPLVGQRPPTTAFNNNGQQRREEEQTTAGQQPIVQHRTTAQKPQVPPKPQLDIVRYSMANAKDDLDLDTILSELLELENQLSSEVSDHFLLHGLPSLPNANSNNKFNGSTRQPNSFAFNGTTPVTVPEVCSSQLQSKLNCPFTQFGPLTETGVESSRQQSDLCASPDVDSAFGDSSSTECSSGSGGNRCRNSEFSSAASYRGSLNETPSPTHIQASPISGVNDASVSTLRAPSSLSSSTGGDLKAQKIREALEKMKEAKMKKIYVKIFLEDETTRGLLIDERWTVAETMRQLAEKTKTDLTPEHAILEEYPDLHFKRIYEDHEFVVENIEDWLADSKNKLYFIRLPDKYSFVRNPQDYLLSEKSKSFENFPPLESPEWNSEVKQSLLKTFLNSENNAVPEMEGWLILKADGKKAWKKHYFVLRSSGLYYYPKSGKMRGTKDLQCLMNVYNNQIYTCLDWRKKYKAPTSFGFAIKHPRIQVKTSKYIKYICAEDEKTFQKWVTALRITRNGFQTLYKNYCSMSGDEGSRSSLAGHVPIRVEVPQISLQRLSSLDQSALSSTSKFNSQASINSPTVEHPPSMSSLCSARVSVLSQANSSDRASPASMAFDQDECGTIKRQPLTFNDISPCLQYPPTSRSAIQKGLYNPVDGCSALPTTSSYSNSPQGEDSDSDEDEQLPPPPQETVQRVFLPMNSSRSFEGARPSVPPKPLSASQMPTTPRGKVPPPPPPKRAEVTQLGNQHIPSPNTPQSDLYSELQKATARQKQRIEGN